VVVAQGRCLKEGRCDRKNGGRVACERRRFGVDRADCGAEWTKGLGVPWERMGQRHIVIDSDISLACLGG
jgi:hypothetical protein